MKRTKWFSAVDELPVREGLYEVRFKDLGWGYVNSRAHWDGDGWREHHIADFGFCEHDQWRGQLKPEK